MMNLQILMTQFQSQYSSITGPMYYNGIYHLFYQHNPYGPLWGNMTWAHSISYDLINWVHLDHALNPIDPFDINGCWSGSTTILPGGKPAILYTGKDTKNHEVQNLAVPKNLSDPLLIEWVKSAHNPIMTPVNGIDPFFYRDPTTAWQGSNKRWRVIVGSQIDGHGTAILYTSEDFVNWTRSESPLHSSNRTGMWECPDFYPVSVEGNGRGIETKYVLKASFNHQDHYVIGLYDPKTDIYVVDTDFMDSALQLRYDYGKFYASKTFLDSGKKRRVLWAWIEETDSKSDDIEKGWSGLQADVEVSFVLPKFEETEMMEQNLVDPQLLCSQNQASVEGLFGPFGLLVLASKDLTEQTAIFFRIFRSHSKYVVLMSSLRDEVEKTTYGAFIDVDPSSETVSLRSLTSALTKMSASGLRKPSGISAQSSRFRLFIFVVILTGGVKSLEALHTIDHSIVESFGGEGVACITARVYPKLATDKDAHLYAFNNGTQSVKISKLSAWSMKEAQFFQYRKEERHFSNYDK
ncbi:hypothetical protein RHMOL_Rhmol11G0097600 [Rhododendron molle]|uniref:Uncharacterized protein n=1 Tax=Rhododendron molle TaxID=49168 RepID=A0ACC0LRI7_RHOML|nr:hypothetical protein RHMOL_Rhmol11G0097600 [Rhododendron molle]